MKSEHFDVIIVGAGLSGIGSAYHLQKNCPNKRYAILEGRTAMGGTWDLFRYPGIRSDSDMYTLGYRFKPWKEDKSMADGSSILNYVTETAKENSIDQHIRYDQKVISASWSSKEATWKVETQCQQTGETTLFYCNFLLMCAGYYQYSAGYTPEFKDIDHFQGNIVHPQTWPKDLNYTNKKVVIIGSGATAVTLVPELAKKASHVVMLQRSPSYVLSLPGKDVLANILKKILPEQWAYAITRWKNVSLQQLLYRLTRTRPKIIKDYLSKMARKALGNDYDIHTHFNPSYEPWDQRLCFIPDNDFFNAIKAGDASIITDQIDCFTKTGIQLKSGKEVIADIIVTATGFHLELLGGTQFTVDDKPVEFPETYTYKGMMYSDVPNLASVFGYINASWTLHSDLVAEYVCRLINHMDNTDTQQCTARLRTGDKSMPTQPWIDNFSSGYIQRAIHLFPKQGSLEPWVNPQNYQTDKRMMREQSLEDGIMIFNNNK